MMRVFDENETVIILNERLELICSLPRDIEQSSGFGESDLLQAMLPHETIKLIDPRPRVRAKYRALKCSNALSVAGDLDQQGVIEIFKRLSELADLVFKRCMLIA